MKNNTLATLLSILFVFIQFIGVSQTTVQTGLEATLHESGKIYVVVAVLATVFIGIIYFLIRTDLKIKKIEKDLGN